MTSEPEELTLEEYLTALSDSDKELLKGLPLTADELIDIDDEELDALKIRPGSTKEEQARRSEIFEEIWRLRIFAKMESEAQDHEWNYYMNRPGLEELAENVFYKVNERPALPHWLLWMELFSLAGTCIVYVHHL